MPPIPQGSIVLRTWYGGDQQQWERLVAAVETPSEEGFTAYVSCISNPAFDGVSVGAFTKQQSGAIVSFIADQITLNADDFPILAVLILPRQPGDERPTPEPFRVIASELWAVENNLNISNMDWQDFTRSLGDDGVYRG